MGAGGHVGRGLARGWGLGVGRACKGRGLAGRSQAPALHVCSRALSWWLILLLDSRVCWI